MSTNAGSVDDFDEARGLPPALSEISTQVSRSSELTAFVLNPPLFGCRPMSVNSDCRSLQWPASISRAGTVTNEEERQKHKSMLETNVEMVNMASAIARFGASLSQSTSIPWGTIPNIQVQSRTE